MSGYPTENSVTFFWLLRMIPWLGFPQLFLYFLMLGDMILTALLLGNPFVMWFDLGCVHPAVVDLLKRLLPLYFLILIHPCILGYVRVIFLLCPEAAGDIRSDGFLTFVFFSNRQMLGFLRFHGAILQKCVCSKMCFNTYTKWADIVGFLLIHC